jgi:hypothetical protein
MIRRSLLGGLQCLVVLMLTLTLVPLSARAQGNSDAAHACQGDGYLYMAGTNGETFGNVGQCVRFAAQGGKFAEGAIVVPAGFSVTFSSQVLSACNELSFGYSLNGGGIQYLGSKGAGCTTIPLPDVTVGPVGSGSVLVIYLTDVTCGMTYGSDGFHARVGGAAPVFSVDLADSGPGCGIANQPWTGSTAGNLSLMVSIHP